MAMVVEATYENGVLKPDGPLPLKEHEKVRITVHTPADVQSALSALQRSYGLIPWTGDAETLERIALDPEFGIEEAP